MLTYLARRLLEFVVVILGVLTIVFLLQRLSGDPTNMLLPIDAPEQVRAELRRQLGLDRPIVIQYLQFLGNVAQGDLGDSYRFRQPALGLVLDRLPAT
jgi:peptide/nickel transport system permease protein